MIRLKDEATNTIIGELSECKETQTKICGVNVILASCEDSDSDVHSKVSDGIITCMPVIEPCPIEYEFTQGTGNRDSEDEESSQPPGTEEDATTAAAVSAETPAEPTDRELCVLCQVPIVYSFRI